MKLSYKLILLILGGIARPAQITQNNKKEVTDEVDFSVEMSITVIYKLIPSFLMSVAKVLNIPKILNKTSMQCLISRKN